MLPWRLTVHCLISASAFGVVIYFLVVGLPLASSLGVEFSAGQLRALDWILWASLLSYYLSVVLLLPAAFADIHRWRSRH